MNGQRTRKSGNLLPFRVIEAAANGDVDAINKVLKHYDAYIIVLSTRRMFDEGGNTHYFVDDEMRRTLETKRILSVYAEPCGLCAKTSRRERATDTTP